MDHKFMYVGEEEREKITTLHLNDEMEAERKG